MHCEIRHSNLRLQGTPGCPQVGFWASFLSAHIHLRLRIPVVSACIYLALEKVNKCSHARI